MSIEPWVTRPTTPLSYDLDRMSEQVPAPLTASSVADGTGAGYQSLPVDVWESEAAYHATLMAPGLDKKTINITFHEDTLFIEGSLTLQAPPEAPAVREEFGVRPGPVKFRRSLRLGASVDTARSQAVYRNGLLVLTMRKAKYAVSRQIQVKVIS